MDVYGGQTDDEDDRPRQKGKEVKPAKSGSSGCFSGSKSKPKPKQRSHKTTKKMCKGCIKMTGEVMQDVDVVECAKCVGGCCSDVGSCFGCLCKACLNLSD